jgi:mitochondrial fission protein ELM1
MTTSRRTPAETEELLSKLSAKNLSFTPNEATDASWVSNRLKIASRVWVTVDSVSMVYEAITSGAEVGLLSLESSSSKSRVAAAIEDLKQQKIVLTDTHLAEDYSRTEEVFNEADRCALLIVKKFF